MGPTQELAMQVGLQGSEWLSFRGSGMVLVCFFCFLVMFVVARDVPFSRFSGFYCVF